jgi:hypothetical protein
MVANIFLFELDAVADGGVAAGGLMVGLLLVPLLLEFYTKILFSYMGHLHDLHTAIQGAVVGREAGLIVDPTLNLHEGPIVPLLQLGPVVPLQMALLVHSEYSSVEEFISSSWDRGE